MLIPHYFLLIWVEELSCFLLIRVAMWASQSRLSGYIKVRFKNTSLQPDPTSILNGGTIQLGDTRSGRMRTLQYKLEVRNEGNEKASSRLHGGTCGGCGGAAAGSSGQSQAGGRREGWLRLRQGGPLHP